MATITENLQTIKNSTLAMKQAIIDKGGTINGDITTYADAINNIEVDLSDYATKEELNEKQDKLLSGTNIKTINGESILGEGNITIESGTEQIQADWNETDTTSKSYIANKPNIYVDEHHNIVVDNTAMPNEIGLWSTNAIGQIGIKIGMNHITWYGFNGENESTYTITNSGDGTVFLSNDGTYKSISTSYPQVNHGTSDTTFALTPNVLHVWDEVAELSLTLANPTDTNIANEYLFQFTSGATATTLTLPDTIKWANDAPPTIVENMIYQVSILNGLAGVLEFKNAAPIVLITFYYNNSPYSAEEGMTWKQWCNSTYNSTTLGIHNNIVMANGMYQVSNSSGMLIYGTDVIIDNEHYAMMSGGA